MCHDDALYKFTFYLLTYLFTYFCFRIFVPAFSGPALSISSHYTLDNNVSVTHFCRL